MGCYHSRIDREETVSRCKARKRYMKEFVRARHAFSAAHAMYVRSLRSTGSALLQFANIESSLHHRLRHAHHSVHHHHHLPPLIPSPPPRPPNPPPMSPSSGTTWNTDTSSMDTPRPPPPPPPVLASSIWDFWDPFVPQPPPPSSTTEEWTETTVQSDAAAAEAKAAAVEAKATAAASVAAPPSVVSGFSKDTGSEFALVVSRNVKDLSQIITELDEYFLKAAKSGGEVSSLLEVPSSSISTHMGAKMYNIYGRGFSPSLTWAWGSNAKLNGFGRLGEEMVASDMAGGGSFGGDGHRSTAERLCAWEKKLFLEVKSAEKMKMKHERKAGKLPMMELKKAEYVKIQNAKKEVERLESRMEVASRAIESISAEIIKLRESELYPQLLKLVNGLMCMWRSMYECHQVQAHLVQQLKFINPIPSMDPTSEIHRQSALQLELEVQRWHLSFCNLVKAQREYIQSLAGWLRLSVFYFNKTWLSQARQESALYSLCEEWLLAIDRFPDRVASEGIKNFLTVIHTIVVQHAEEYKQKKKSEAAFRALEKKAVELRSLEHKYGPLSGLEAVRMTVKGNDLIVEVRAKVEVLKAKAEEEKVRHEKCIGVSRAMTLNNLQMGFPHVFQAVTGFSSVCMQAFESIYSQAKNEDQGRDVKRLLP